MSNKILLGAEPVCGACGRRLGHRTLKMAKQCLGQRVWETTPGLERKKAGRQGLS